MGWACRWKHKELAKLQEFEKTVNARIFE